MDLIAGDWHFWTLNLDDIDIFKTIHSIGFDGIEIGVRKEEDLSPIRINTLEKLGKEINLPVKMLSCFYPPQLWERRVSIENDKQTRERAIKLMLKAFEAGDVLNVDNIGIWLGADRIRREDDFNKSWNNTRDFLMELLEKTEKYRQNLLIEYKPGEIINNSDAFLRMADSIGNPRFGLLLDTGHAIMQGEDIAVCVNKTINYLRHIHLDDNNSDCDADMVPGYYHNFQSMFERLKYHKYEGLIGLDLYYSIEEWQLDPKRLLDQSRNYILSILKET